MRGSNRIALHPTASLEGKKTLLHPPHFTFGFVGQKTVCGDRANRAHAGSRVCHMSPLSITPQQGKTQLV